MNINEIVRETNNYPIKKKEKYYCPDKPRMHFDNCLIKYRTKQYRL